MFFNCQWGVIPVLQGQHCSRVRVLSPGSHVYKLANAPVFLRFPRASRCAARPGPAGGWWIRILPGRPLLETAWRNAGATRRDAEAAATTAENANFRRQLLNAGLIQVHILSSFSFSFSFSSFPYSLPLPPSLPPSLTPRASLPPIPPSLHPSLPRSLPLT